MFCVILPFCKKSQTLKWNCLGDFSRWNFRFKFLTELFLPEWKSEVEWGSRSYCHHPLIILRRIPRPAKFLSGEGLVFCRFCRCITLWSIHDVNIRNGQGVLEQVWKTWRQNESVYGSLRRFREIFSAQSQPNGFRLNSKETKNRTF